MLEQIEDDRHRFLIGDEIGLLDLDVLDDRRDAPEPDAFGDRAAFGRLRFAMGEQIVHRGAARIGAADDDVLLHLAQECRGAGKRAAGPDRADEAVDLAVGLLPDLRPGRDVMRAAVVEIVPLVGEDHAVRLGLAQLVRKAAPDMLIIVRIAVGDGRHLDQLGAAQPQHVLLLLALRLRDHDQGAIAARVRHQRKPDAGIAGGALDHESARLDVAALLGLQDHLAPGAILHRLARDS